MSAPSARYVCGGSDDLFLKYFRVPKGTFYKSALRDHAVR